MAHYGTLRDLRFTEEVDDIRGANLYGINDERLGKIDDVIFDHKTGDVRYAVVDTGGWLTTRKFLVPAARIEPYHKDANDFYASLDRSRIENFPPYDEKVFREEKEWRDYEDRYERAWTDAPVQHRRGSEHNITPTTEEMPPSTTGMHDDVVVTAPDPTERTSSGDFMSGVGTGPAGIHHGAADVAARPGFEAGSPTSQGRRWNRFENMLRRERETLVRDCPTCAPRRRVA